MAAVCLDISRVRWRRISRTKSGTLWYSERAGAPQIIRMRSRTLRLGLSVLTVAAFGGAAFVLIHTEQQIVARRSSVRDFDQRARDATTAIVDARAAQQAYVAAGQGIAFWIPKVAGLLDAASSAVDWLRSAAVSAEARGALMDAAASVTAFGNVDRQAREYLRSNDVLMAADIVFSEGSEVAGDAARQLESARLSEQVAFDAAEAENRKLQAAAAGSAAGLGAVVLVLLALAGPMKMSAAAAVTGEEPPAGHVLLNGVTPPAAPAEPMLPRGSAPVLKAAARLCTEIGRANDPEDLRRILGEVADVLDASGVIVWVGSTSGADLRPALAHGYPPQALARMTSVARTADNAAAAAYRTGSLQIVLSRPGYANGAVVAPLLSPDGCIGALAAEILSGGEVSDGVQALAALVAAQLTPVIASSILAGSDAQSTKAATA
jgi:hypothetical protein